MVSVCIVRTGVFVLFDLYELFLNDQIQNEILGVLLTFPIIFLFLLDIIKSHHLLISLRVI